MTIIINVDTVDPPEKYYKRAAKSLTHDGCDTTVLGRNEMLNVTKPHRLLCTEIVGCIIEHDAHHQHEYIYMDLEEKKEEE
jgi:hypothetical protein